MGYLAISCCCPEVVRGGRGEEAKGTREPVRQECGWGTGQAGRGSLHWIGYTGETRRNQEKPGENAVNQLVAYLLDNLILDFQGELTLDLVRKFLRDDDSPQARALLAKLVADGGVEDMMICIADCLKDFLATGIDAKVMEEQLQVYAES